MTFDLINEISIDSRAGGQRCYEAFCICRKCRKSTTFVLSPASPEAENLLDRNGLSRLSHEVNKYVKIETHISLKDEAATPPPEHLPEDIDAVFREGAACMAIGCCNAAGTMFRLCIDLATRSMLPEKADNLNKNARRSLGLRLPWLFDNQMLPENLKDLSTCIKDDGNDGAHEGTLGKEDAADILDFTFVLLERIYTEPKRIELANQRRIDRRDKKE